MPIKQCERCKIDFGRPKNLSAAQWKGRRFCCNKCASTKNNITAEQLNKMYWEQEKSSGEIAAILKISSVHVLRMMKLSGIKTRSHSDSIKLSHNRDWVKKKISASQAGLALSEQAKEKLRERVGSKNHNWGGGLTISNQGYVTFTASKANGENAGKSVHVLMAEFLYGKDEVKNHHVHHIDGDKMNNSFENLCLLSASDHAKIHTEDRENGKRIKGV